MHIFFIKKFSTCFKFSDDNLFCSSKYKFCHLRSCRFESVLSTIDDFSSRVPRGNKRHACLRDVRWQNVCFWLNHCWSWLIISLWLTERKNPLKDQVPGVVREIFTRLMDNYPEFSACGGTVAAFVMQSRKSAAQEVIPQPWHCGISIRMSRDMMLLCKLRTDSALEPNYIFLRLCK